MSHCNSSSRPPSPLSDSEDDYQEAEGSVPIDSEIAMTAPLSTSVFHCPDTTYPNYMVLQTNLNMCNSKNKKTPYPILDTERKTWTDKQRVLASQAMVPVDSSNFAVKVGVL
jgi:hypothetical protein